MAYLWAFPVISPHKRCRVTEATKRSRWIQAGLLGELDLSTCPRMLVGSKQAWGMIRKNYGGLGEGRLGREWGRMQRDLNSVFPRGSHLRRQRIQDKHDT